MSDIDYLQSILNSQVLADDSPEMEELRQHREDVEGLLRKQFASASPTIRYGGSKAKGTLIKESYDLDLVCYFPSGENGAGETLKAIYENVERALAPHYFVQPKTSAIRLRSSNAAHTDFHIDVVPGRFTDDKKSDCFLHQNGADKDRLKTNLEVHIAHIKDAGVTPALRLLKLWRVRKNLDIKNFVWELLCIKMLAEARTKPLDQQLVHVLTKVANSTNAIGIEDPANPQGNDVMPFLRSIWPQLNAAAAQTLRAIGTAGWQGVFGDASVIDSSSRTLRLTAAAQSVQQPTRPWNP